MTKLKLDYVNMAAYQEQEANKLAAKVMIVWGDYLERNKGITPIDKVKITPDIIIEADMHIRVIYKDKLVLAVRDLQYGVIFHTGKWVKTIESMYNEIIAKRYDYRFSPI